MKGIEEIKRKDGSTAYDAHYMSKRKYFRKRFETEKEAKIQLEQWRKEYPNQYDWVPKENERFSDIQYSGFSTERDERLYMAFDSECDAYRLVTSSQIKSKTGIGRKGRIAKRKDGKWQLVIRHGQKNYYVGTFDSKKDAIEENKKILKSIALGKPLKIECKNSTGYKNIIKDNHGDKKFCFRTTKSGKRITKRFYTLQEALDFREKYFKENGLEMPKDYIELNFN